MIGYPFDSHVTFESDGTAVYDRAITSAPLRKLYKKLFTDGVMPNPSTNMQVSAGTGMNVIVSPGFAMCNGCMKLEESQRTLAVQASSAMYDRIDTVVLRLNDNDSERICDFYIVEGTPAVSPVRSELTRTESIWELGLADLFIAKNSTEISNQRITDTRYEMSRCGIVSSVSEFDTETLYQQVQADLAGFKAEEQADFIAWFEEIKNQLSEDAAGNLQIQIGRLPSLMTEVKESLVSAINWVVEKLNAVKAMLGEKDISSIGDGTVTGAIVQLNTNFQNYLPSKGGILTGNLDIQKNDTAQVMVKSQNHGISGVMSANQYGFGLYDTKHSKWISRCDKNGNVSHSGNAESATTATKLSDGTNVISPSDVKALSVKKGVTVGFNDQALADYGVDCYIVNGIAYVNGSFYTHVTGNNLLLMNNFPIPLTEGILQCASTNGDAASAYVDNGGGVYFDIKTPGVWYRINGAYPVK